MSTSSLVTLSYQTTNLLFDRETNTGDLTALWRAMGSPQFKEPWKWLQSSQAFEIIEALLHRENLAKNEVLENQENHRQEVVFQKENHRQKQVFDAAEKANLLFTRQGRTGGTWAHWQIAVGSPGTELEFAL